LASFASSLKELNLEFEGPEQEIILTGILVGGKDPNNEIAKTASKL
jgi:hypothetical protein